MRLSGFGQRCLTFMFKSNGTVEIRQKWIVYKKNLVGRMTTWPFQANGCKNNGTIDVKKHFGDL